MQDEVSTYFFFLNITRWALSNICCMAKGGRVLSSSNEVQGVLFNKKGAESHQVFQYFSHDSPRWKKERLGVEAFLLLSLSANLRITTKVDKFELVNYHCHGIRVEEEGGL